MEVISYSKFRQNLKSLMDKVMERHEPLYVKRSKGEDMVLISKSDYESMEETLHLLDNPINAQRISKGLEEFNKGGGTPRALID